MNRDQFDLKRRRYRSSTGHTTPGNGNATQGGRPELPAAYDRLTQRVPDHELELHRHQAGLEPA